MEKQNFGIPVALLSAAAYAMGYYSVWAVVGFTIVAFAFKFSTNVKKSAIQASVLSIIFLFADMIMRVFNSIIGVANGSIATSMSKVWTFIDGSLGNIHVGLIAILILLSISGSDLIFSAFTKNVE